MARESTISDGNSSQYDKVKAMREKRDGVQSPQQARNEDGTFATNAATPEAIAAEQVKLVEQAQAPAAVAPVVEPEKAPAATPAVPPVAAAPAPAPATVEIEIDGQKVAVDPSLAEAFKQAEAAQADAKKTSERDAMKAELREELKAELAPAAKQAAAEAAADAAIRAAEEAAKQLPPEPDAQLLISNPDEYVKQQKAHSDAKLKLEIDKVKRETLAAVQTQQQTDAKTQEAHARAVLREQFFAAYPVLKPSADLVDPVLNAKFDEVIASGRLAKPLSPTDGEALKKEVFADVAAKSTRKAIGLMQQAKTLAPPPPPPPTAVSSAPTAPKKAPVAEPEKPKEKFPRGSVSALLHQRQNSLRQPAA